MKWKSIVAGALASVLGTLFIAGLASADVRIVNDPGGEVSSYLRTFYEMRATGDRIVIDGPCLSACTLLTGAPCVAHGDGRRARSLAIARRSAGATATRDHLARGGLIAWQCRARRYTRPLSDLKVANASIGAVEILL